MTIYALVASDEPLQVRYVGQTVQALALRLRGHLNEMQHPRRRIDQRKTCWMRDVLERGARVLIEPLSIHENREELNAAERKWAQFWASYCEVLNIQGLEDMRHIGTHEPSARAKWRTRVTLSQ